MQIQKPARRCARARSTSRAHAGGWDEELVVASPSGSFGQVASLAPQAVRCLGRAYHARYGDLDVFSTLGIYLSVTCLPAAVASIYLL
jgi:hypothetical protein